MTRSCQKIVNEGHQLDVGEEQKKTILILKSKAFNISAAENFLRNREWQIFTTDNLKNALTHIVQHKPAFVLISVDHPNKKVRSLPKILVQAFPVCVMAFAESSSAASFKMLTDSGSEYLLYPPLTGPAVERTVNKYYKDLATKRNQSSNTDKWDSSGGDKDTMISIKGGQSDAMNFKGEAVHAQNLFAQLMNDDNGSDDGPLMQPGYGSADAHSARSSEASGVGGFIPSSSTSSTPSSSSADPSSTDSSLLAPSSSGGSTAGSTGSDGFQGQTPPPPEAASSTDPHEGSRRRKKDAGGGWVPVDPPPGDSHSSNGSSSGYQRNQESIIFKGTKEALEKSVISGKHVHAQPVQKVEQSSNVACIIIESPRFSGYLVTAMGKNRKIDAAFLKGIHERLFKFLRENGESIKQEETMNIKIREVPFEDWALDCAEFLRKSVHNGDEVAMAFFPYADAKAALEDSHHSEMASVKIADLQADKEVEFNLYVYLPSNQKYVLYTPRGGKFYGSQKERLTKQGVTHMHMLRVEAEDLNKYRAQNYLNEKIGEFESRQRERKKTA